MLKSLYGIDTGAISVKAAYTANAPDDSPGGTGTYNKSRLGASRDDECR